MAREGLNPRHADFQGVSGLSAENRGERLDIFQQGHTVRSMVAQHQPEPFRNAESRY
jgi:hypothetical protein